MKNGRHLAAAALMLAASTLSATVPFAAEAQQPGRSERAAVIDPAQIVSARLLPGWRTAQGTRMAALKLVLKPGWKTYWRAPGDAGIPPRFDWTGSRNVAAVQMHWPSPHVFYLNGMQSIGYTGELVLPIEFTPQTQGSAMAVVASIDIGVCRDICVPVNLMLQATVAAALGATTDPADDAAIRRALGDRPQSGDEAGVAAVRCRISPIADGLRLTAEIEMPASGGDEVGVLEVADPGVWVAAAQTSRAGGRLTIATELVPQSGAPFMLDRSALRITVLAGERVVDLRGCPAG